MAIDRLAKLAIDIVVNSGRAVVHLRQLNQSFNKSANAVNAMNDRIVSLGSSAFVFELFRRTIINVIEVTLELNKAFADFETQVVNINKIAKAGNLNKLADSFKELTSNLGGIASLDEVAKTMQGAARSGIRFGKGLEELTATAVRFAKVSDDISPENAALGLSQVRSNFKISKNEIENLGAAIDALSDSFTTTSGQILQSTARLSGIAQAAGLTATETAALSTAFLKAGVTATITRTTITRLFTQLQDDPLLVMKALRLSEEEFRQFTALIKKEPVEGIKDFVRQLRKIGPAASQEALKTLGISSSRLQQSLAILKVRLDEVDAAMRIGNKAYKEGTNLLEKQFEVMQTTNSQLQELTNNWALFKATIGENVKIVDTLNGALMILDQFMGGKPDLDIESILGKEGDKTRNTEIALKELSITIKTLRREAEELKDPANQLLGFLSFGLVKGTKEPVAAAVRMSQIVSEIAAAEKRQAILQETLTKLRKAGKEEEEKITEEKKKQLELTKEEIQRLEARKDAEIASVMGKRPRFNQSRLDISIASVNAKVERWATQIDESRLPVERFTQSLQRLNMEAMGEIERLRQQNRAEEQKKFMDFIGEVNGLSGEFSNVLSTIQQAQALQNNPLVNRIPGLQGALAGVLGAQLTAGQAKPQQSQFIGLTEAWKKAQIQTNKKDSALRVAQLRLARVLTPWVLDNPAHQRRIETLLQQIFNRLEQGDIGR